MRLLQVQVIYGLGFEVGVYSKHL